MCNQLAEIASFSQGKCEAAMRTATHNVTITLGHKGGATEGLLVLQTSKSGGWFSNIEQPACMQGRGRVKRGSEDSSSSERRGKQCAHVEERAVLRDVRQVFCNGAACPNKVQQPMQPTKKGTLKVEACEGQQLPSALCTI
eukprot:1161489-Pelagomonas_calceolata.AAC.9